MAFEYLSTYPLIWSGREGEGVIYLYNETIRKGIIKSSEGFSCSGRVKTPFRKFDWGLANVILIKP